MSLSRRAGAEQVEEATHSGAAAMSRTAHAEVATGRTRWSPPTDRECTACPNPDTDPKRGLLALSADNRVRYVFSDTLASEISVLPPGSGPSPDDSPGSFHVIHVE
ncbi:MAG: hypothetical protein JRE71_16665 [Deltaproteobacteria bacterium]|nr:hypothetical protein [Deltaproteobacteria bacterium]